MPVNAGLAVGCGVVVAPVGYPVGAAVVVVLPKVELDTGLVGAVFA